MDPGGELESGSCCATLITEYHAITAAHCFTDGEWKSFEVQVDPAGNKRTVDKVYLSKCFIHDDDGPNSGDLAIIRFSKKVTSVDPYPIYTFGDEVGKEFKIVGWGNSGKVGIEQNNPTYEGKFHVANNKFEKACGGTLDYTFDDPEDGGLTGEGLAAAGDSGSPAMIMRSGEYYIAGVNSGGTCCEFGSTD